MAAFENAGRSHWLKVVAHRPAAIDRIAPRRLLTGNSVISFVCDDTGLFQHAVHSVPDQLARGIRVETTPARLLASLNNPGEQRLSESDGPICCFRAALSGIHDTGDFANFRVSAVHGLSRGILEDSHARKDMGMGASPERLSPSTPPVGSHPLLCRALLPRGRVSLARARGRHAAGSESIVRQLQ